ncbi:MAG: hypothetical protein ACKPKO_20300, partial [Candidatus Fonsibacter sp.]
ALNAPEHCKPTMTMLYTFDYEEDEMHVIATAIYRHMRSRGYTPDDLIFGTVYISSETIDNIINFTHEDLAYICNQAIYPQDSETT